MQAYLIHYFDQDKIALLMQNRTNANAEPMQNSDSSINQVRPACPGQKVTRMTQSSFNPGNNVFWLASYFLDTTVASFLYVHWLAHLKLHKIN